MVPVRRRKGGATGLGPRLGVGRGVGTFTGGVRGAVTCVDGCRVSLRGVSHRNKMIALTHEPKTIMWRGRHRLDAKRCRKG